METAIQVVTQKTNPVLDATLNGVGAGSRPVYAGAIQAYIDWASENHQEGAYASIIGYRRVLEERGLQISTINRHLSALRAFFRTAYNMGQIDRETYDRIREAKNIHSQGQKQGVWLTLDDARRLLAAPDTTTWIGKRDKAILAVMLGGGLRRSEVVHLTWEHLVWREGAWVIENLLGKHNRTRSIPLQDWVWACLEDLRGWDAHPTGAIFRSMDRHGNIHVSMTAHSIWLIVLRYAQQIGIPKLAPHDLRRTYAELIRKGGGELEEVQQLLGHSSLAVTQRYLQRGVDPGRVSQLIDMEG